MTASAGGMTAPLREGDGDSTLLAADLPDDLETVKKNGAAHPGAHREGTQNSGTLVSVCAERDQLPRAKLH